MLHDPVFTIRSVHCLSLGLTPFLDTFNAQHLQSVKHFMLKTPLFWTLALSSERSQWKEFWPIAPKGTLGDCVITLVIIQTQISQ